MRGGSQPHDQFICGWVAEIRNSAAPIFPFSIALGFFPGDRLAPFDQSWTSAARNDSVVQGMCHQNIMARGEVYPRRGGAPVSQGTPAILNSLSRWLSIISARACARGIFRAKSIASKG